MVLPDDGYSSVHEAAEELKVSASSIRRWITRGELPAYRVGKRRVVLRRADIAALIMPVRQQHDVKEEMVLSAHQHIRALTVQDQQQGRDAVAAAKRLQAQLLARRGEKFSPSWELLNALRDERSQQQ